MDGTTSENRESAARKRSASAGRVFAEPAGSAPRNGGTTRPPLRRFIAATLVVYWVGLFAATHVPISETPVSFRGVDKVAHFVAYGVLGLLLASWVSLRRPLTFKTALLIWISLAAYGALDELLQIPVGRTCELGDWIADIAGAGLGVLAVLVLSRLRRQRSSSPEHLSLATDHQSRER